MLSDEAIADIATEIIRGSTDPASVSVEVRSDQDFDGTEIIRVTARYSRRPQGEAYRGLDPMHDIRTALLAQGEDRFVFLENIYEDEPRDYDEDAA